jgi:iron(III) transport system substrate-binding protein
MKLSKSLLAILIYLTGLNLNLSDAIAQDVVAAAKKEGEVLLYLSTNLADANGMIQLFKQKYPFINVNFFRADNEKLLNRILTESTTGKFNGDAIMISSFEVRVLLQKKLLQKYVSPHSQYYPEGFTDKDGFPDRGDVTSDLKEGTKLYPADPRWGDSYAKHVEEFREIFFK